MKGENLSKEQKAAITRDLFERYRQGGKTSQTENEVIESLEKDFIPPKDFDVTDELIDELDTKTRAFVFQEIEKTKKRTLYPMVWGAVASIALLIVGTFVFFNLQNTQTESVEQQYIASDVIENVTLSDGSKIVLNRGTTLRETSREVWLDEGEAFFDVKSDTKKPFIVHLRDGVKVQVLGTSFTIQSYAQLPFQEISVLSGQVSVATSIGETVELAPNQQATYFENKKQLSKESTNSEQKAAWRQGTVVLKNAMLDELRFRINQIYNKNIVFEQQPQTIFINIMLNKTTSVEEIATEIASLYALSYKIEADEIVFYPR